MEDNAHRRMTIQRTRMIGCLQRDGLKHLLGKKQAVGTVSGRIKTEKLVEDGIKRVIRFANREWGLIGGMIASQKNTYFPIDE